jgi:ferredoxin-thioredoxin reductase catalytic subunit
LVSLDKVKKRAEIDAKDHGYYLNPDLDFLNDILEGLRKNEEQYGCPFCPCRLTSGIIEKDRDIICPCDYRDSDVEEYGQCFCALFVGKDLYKGRNEARSIPERRSNEKLKHKHIIADSTKIDRDSTNHLIENQRIWYCKQCGYLCFRETPPFSCPICKAKKEMFSQINIEFKVNYPGN